MFVNGQRDRGSIPGRVISKTQKRYFMARCLTLTIISCGPRVKWSNPGNGVAPSSIPRSRSYWNGSLRVTLDYGRQAYIYIYIYMCVCVCVCVCVCMCECAFFVYVVMCDWSLTVRWFNVIRRTHNKSVLTLLQKFN